MVRVKSFCVDRYEAHLVLATSDDAFTRHPHNSRPQVNARYLARSEPNELPQGYISRLEAAEACQNSHKRLCTIQEWYQACRGEPASTYGYGSHYINGRCNVGKPHLLSAFFGINARAWKYDEHFNNPLLLQQKGYLEGSGHLPDCRSSFGTFDMVGNLHEWVSDTVGASLAYKIPLQSDIRRRLRANAGKGVFMGGFFSTTNQHGRGCGFVTIAHEARYHDYSTGFRCCGDI
jgi:formylglycine-generating enzyme required for sulfatase activity